MGSPFMTLNKTITAVTRSLDPIVATNELKSQLLGHDSIQSNIRFVLFFCSTIYDLTALGQSMANSFGDLPVVGCTTSGEITEQGYEQHCIVAIGFCEQHFSINAQLVGAIDNFDIESAQSTINKLTEQCKSKSVAPIANNTFILTLLDGLSFQEEQFLNILNSASGGIPHFGGSAGDDTNLTKTFVYYQGKFYSQAAVVVMVNTDLPFEVLSINHIDKAGEKLVVTESDPVTRTVYELNAEPAAVEYARLLGMAVEDLNPDVFSINPLAVMVGGNYFFRSIQKVNQQDQSLTFYCAVDNGIVLTAIELGDVFNNLDKKLSQFNQDIGAPEITLACDCILRRLEIEQSQLNSTANKLFIKHKVIGFNTYGEHQNGVHLNQTFTGVFISGEPKNVN